MRVVVITDRRLCAGADLLARIAAILADVPRGSVAIQVREKDLDGGALLALVRDVIAVARPRGAPVWVNNRVDVARIAGATGVHLPERGVTIADARAAGGAKLAIGCSRHTAIAAGQAARDGADLIQVGPIWDTPGKDPPSGVALVQACALVTRGAQVVAVGGIDSPERARAAAAAGATAVAVIRAAWSGPTSAIAALVAAVASPAIRAST